VIELAWHAACSCPAPAPHLPVRQQPVLLRLPALTASSTLQPQQDQASRLVSGAAWQSMRLR
jgi:hypothetical protein